MATVILHNNELLNSEITTHFFNDFHKDNLLDGLTFTYWKGTHPETNEMVIDLLEDKYIGAIAFGGHNFSEVDAEITIYKSSNNENWIKAAEILNINTDNSRIVIVGDETASGAIINLEGTTRLNLDGSVRRPLQSETNTYRYWKIEFKTTSYPQIALMFMGPYIKFEYPPITPVTPVSEGIIVKGGNSEEGHALPRDIRYHPKNGIYTFKDLTRDFWNSSIDPFWHNHAKWCEGFFVAWDLDNRPNDVYFAIVDESYKHHEELTMLQYSDKLSIPLKMLA